MIKHFIFEDLSNDVIDMQQLLVIDFNEMYNVL